MRIFQINNINFNPQFSKPKFQNQKDNETNAESNFDTNPMEIIGRSMINFKGAEKFFNKQDLAFIEIISRELKIAKEEINSLKKVITDFLDEKNLKSMSEMHGEKYMNEQCSLAERIYNRFPTDDLHFEYLIGEVVNRCDMGDNYVPRTFEDDKKYIGEIGNLIKEAYKQNPDIDFLSVITKNLRLPLDKTLKLENVISDYLNSIGANSMQDLANSKYLYIQTDLLNEIVEKMDLNDYEMAIFAQEMVRWIYTEGEYIPATTHLQLDSAVFTKVCVDVGIDTDFRQILFDTMHNEAFEKGYDTIFEILHNDYANSKTYKLLSQYEDQEKAINLSIEFAELANKNKRDKVDVEERPFTRAFQDITKDLIFINKFKQRFGLTADENPNILKIIMKRYPEGVKNGENASNERLAYELAEKYGLSSSEQKEILEIFKEAEKMNPDDIDDSMLNQINLL